MDYPITRLRRLRRSEPMRALVRETHLQPGALIYPMFLCPGEGVRREISSMPGVFNLSVDEAAKEAEAAPGWAWAGCCCLACRKPRTRKRPEPGPRTASCSRRCGLQRQPRAGWLLMIADVCLCEYTSHGHCGVVKRTGEAYEIENDASVDIIAKTAVSLAQAGADIVAPSDMMDGRVAAIRDELDVAGLENTPIPVRTPRSSPRRSMGRSGRRRIRRRSLGTGAAIRWTEPTCARQCGRSSWTWRKART